MRAVVQRVSRASVTVAGEVVGAVDGPGILLLVGVTHDDGPEQAAWLARKVAGLRIMRDESSVADLGAAVLVVSQFTLYGDARKGRRPTWQDAAPGPVAEPRLRRGVHGTGLPRRAGGEGSLRRGHGGVPRQRRTGHDLAGDAAGA